MDTPLRRFSKTTRSAWAAVGCILVFATAGVSLVAQWVSTIPEVPPDEAVQSGSTAEGAAKPRFRIRVAEELADMEGGRGEDSEGSQDRERSTVTGAAVEDDSEGVLGEPADGARTDDGVTPMDSLRARRIPAYAYGREPIGLAHSAILRDPDLMEVESPFRGGPVRDNFKLGPARGSGWIFAPRTSLGLYGLQQGGPPQNAELKLGIVYVNLESVGFSLLASDNVNLTEKNPKSDVIGIFTIGTTVTIQLAEALQYSTYLQFAWLPFEGDAGFNGFAGSAPYFMFDLLPKVAGDLVLGWTLGDWDFEFYDTYSLSVGILREMDRAYEMGTDGLQFFEADRAGRYVFVPRRNFGVVDEDEEDNFDRNNDAGLFMNTVGLRAQTYFPTDVRFRAGASRTDYWWFNRDNDEKYRYVEWVERYNARMDWQRENLRFKPYIGYRGTRVDFYDGIRNTVYTGLRGPITDQLQLNTALGYSWNPENEDGGRWVWDLSLRHEAGPYTTHAVRFSQTVSEFNDLIVREAGYYLNQILSPRWTLDFVAQYLWFETLDDDSDYERSLFITEARFSWVLSSYIRLYPRLRFEASDYGSGSSDYLRYTAGLDGTWDLSRYTQVQLNSSYSYTDGERWDTNRFFLRLGVTHDITETLVGRVYYEYRNKDSDQPGQTYDENVLFLNLTKYFP